MSQEELRKYAESWIIVVTVILSISFVVIYYNPSEPPEKPELEPYLGKMAMLAVLIISASLGLFLLARDPRQSISASKLLNVGIMCFGSGLVIGGIGLGLKTYYLDGDFVNSVFIGTGVTGLVATFLPIYFFKRRKSV